MSSPKSTALFLLFMFILAGVECACADLAWNTVGEIESGVLYSLVILNAVPMLAFFLKRPKIAVALALFLAICIVPRQLVLSARWHFLQQEASGIINYAKLQKKRTGAYPPDLRRYKYIHPGLKKHITYSAFLRPPFGKLANGTYGATGPAVLPDFGISIYIQTPDTPHIYTHSGGYLPDIGDWWYYPD